MKIAFVASFIIGGLLWLSVFQINNSMFSHSGRQTLYQSVKVKNEALAQLMERDLRRLGYGVPADLDGNGILKAGRNEIQFVSTFGGPGTTNFVSLNWSFNPGVTIEDGIENSDGEITLVRKTKNRSIKIDKKGESSVVFDEPEAFAYELGAVDFRFVYYDRYMVEISVAEGSELTETQRNEIRHIGFQLLSESEQSYGDQPERHALERTVTPRNLNI